MNALLNRLPGFVRNLQMKGMAGPMLIIMILGMMVLPLPAFMLDILFTFNIAVSIMVLLVGVNSLKPLIVLLPATRIFPSGCTVTLCPVAPVPMAVVTMPLPTEKVGALSTAATVMVALLVALVPPAPSVTTKLTVRGVVVGVLLLS